MTLKRNKDRQCTKGLIPYRRLPLNLNAFRLDLLHLLRCRLISYSDEVLPLPAKDSFNMGNVLCSED
jgi:hypothetical protein